MRQEFSANHTATISTGPEPPSWQVLSTKTAVFGRACFLEFLRTADF